jgi:PAS domain S-box-containing protein
VGVAFTDVSEVRRTRDALHRTEETLARLLHAGPAAILVLAAEDNRILDVNDRALAIFGHERQQMMGVAPLDIELWAFASDCVTALRQVHATGKSLAGHGAFRRKNGEAFHSMYSLEPIDYHNAPAVVLMLMEAPERRARMRGA